jgi:hypothetical protein
LSIPNKSNASADNKTPTIKRKIQTKQWGLNNTGVWYEELFSNINKQEYTLQMFRKGYSILRVKYIKGV